MNTSQKSTLAALVLGLTYAFLFYHGEIGLNVLLFDALLIGLALRVRPELGKHPSFIWAVGGLLFSAGSVVIVHGQVSIWAHHLTYFLVLGFAQSRELRFVWFALLLGVGSLFEAPLRQWRRWKTIRRQQDIHSSPVALPWLKQAVIPSLVLVPFVLLYVAANDQFAYGLNVFLSYLSNFSINTNVWWSLLLILFGGVLALGFFYPRIDVSRLVKQQLGFQDKLVRQRPERTQLPRPATQLSLHPRPRQKTLALKTEYRQAVLTFGLLNLLLAAVNATDLHYVWLNPGKLSAATLSQYVHQGTWNLMLSIGLAMLVVLYYFRGNLNFLQDSPYLAPLAKLWMIQNGILALSVGIRNWHYIDAYGLALGRVQIAFVLLLILFGLFTLFRKIRDRLTLTYLLQTNGMAAWLCLLLFAAINWSCVVTRYNLSAQTADEVDWNYLVYELPPDNAFLLHDYPGGKDLMEHKRLSNQQAITDWRSWNYADWRNAE
ncbi:DUF4153 domain-containing protein [Neolewinella persica]|uniref:DUF4153 domain-containing protein n=1 Tax=Neolewinella persica TaxID=70998 RepID=UPI00036460CD|nr:DUF4173 domain-containing protein [Neolewinella persica]